MFVEFVNQNIWLFAGFAIILNLLLFSIVRGQVKGANTVSVLEMPQLQRNGKSVVIDVNPANNFASQHIAHSVNFPFESITADNKQLLKHKDKTVIVVCQSGTVSTKAAKALINLGFSNINILRGGLLAWTKENLPVTST